MNQNRFDAVTQTLTRLPTRRDVLHGLAGFGLGPGSMAWRPVITGAKKKRRKKSCGFCATRKKGTCKPQPDGLACGIGQICRGGQCECQQACDADRKCLANGTCARACPETFMCGEGCGCGLPTVEGPVYCIVSEGGCETFTQGCESTEECPIGQVCMTTNCATAPFNRCISLCPS